MQLLDADDEAVYETTVASGTTTVILPASLAGTYELRLIYGDIYFYVTSIVVYGINGVANE